MRLSLSTIAERLPMECGARLHDFSDGTARYGRPVLYDPGMGFAEGALYLARGNALPDDAPSCNCAIICVGSAASWHRQGRHVPTIHLSRETNVAVAFNAVQEVFNDCDRWDELLREEVERDLDFRVEDVLAAASTFLGRPFNVVNQNLQTILSTSVTEGADGTGSVSVDDSVMPLTTEINEKIKEVCRIERMIREPYFSALEVTGRSYCNNLYPLGHFAGCISVSEDGRTLTDGELPLIDHFFGLFQKAYAKHLQRYGSNEQTGLDALRHALEHAPLSRNETELLALAPDEQWRCFRLRERRDVRSFPREYMHATLSGIYPKTVYAVVFEGAIVGLVRVPRTTGLATDPQLSDIGDEIWRMGYHCGLSNTFSKLDELDLYLAQAEFAAGRNLDRPLSFFHDYTLSYLLDACVAEMPVDAIMGRGLRNLLDYDAAHDADYVRTLDLYLQNETSATRTARALFVHRSTLIKRLERIWAILDDRLEDPGHRLYYRLCLVLLRHERRGPYRQI